jgi:lysophospholipase L1-like esterase
MIVGSVLWTCLTCPAKLFSDDLSEPSGLRILDAKAACQAGVRLVGRWEIEPTQANCQWPGTGLEFIFKGQILEITLGDSGSGTPHEIAGFQSNYLDVVIEGRERVFLRLEPGVKTYRIVDEDSPDSRLVMIWKRTESSVGKLSFYGIGIDQKATIDFATHPKGTMDFYGDSDACGYGVEVLDRNQHFAPATENAEKAFAVVAIKKLGFDLRLIAASGWGICRGYGGETDFSIPRVAERVFIDQPTPLCDNKPPADVIVVLLGDNDFNKGDPGELFDRSYLQFAESLHHRTPKAKIFLCVGSSLRDKPECAVRSRVSRAIDDILSKLNADHPTPIAFKIDLNTYHEDEGFGADWHTSHQGHERIGNEIANAIRQALD